MEDLQLEDFEKLPIEPDTRIYVVICSDGKILCEGLHAKCKRFYGLFIRLSYVDVNILDKIRHVR